MGPLERALILPLNELVAMLHTGKKNGNVEIIGLFQMHRVAGFERLGLAVGGENI